ncbi:MAG: hypothetical protein HW406_1397 [Candidatus Brocadiaceae bacterium]|nr:hypothetical protein [Candidatus Brocadiaceae bacterium]
MEIRKDFEPVAVYMHKLINLAEAFIANGKQCLLLLENEDAIEEVISLPNNIKSQVVQIYGYGAINAHATAFQLEGFNDANKYPTLSSYIDSFEDYWLTHEVKVNKIYKMAQQSSRNLEYKLFLVDDMLDLLKHQFELQEATKRTLNIIKQSSLYKLETGINDIPTEQATPGARNTPQSPAGEPLNEPQATTQKQGKTKAVIPFPTQPGTKWHELVISFDDTESVTISTKTKTEKRHYFDMGFRKGKSNKPVASWFVLKVLCENGYMQYAETGKAKAEKSIQDLRKRLKAIFGIHGDPITLNDGYRPVFKVCTDASKYRSRSVKDFSNSEELNDDNKDDD